MFTSEENRRDLLAHLPAEELRQLLLSLQQAAGQTASIYTPNGFLISSSGWVDLCESCKDYSHRFQLENSCWFTHGRSAGWQAAIEAEAPVIFQCRRGPCDVRYPLKWEGQWVGTLVVGRFGLKQAENGNLPLPSGTDLVGGRILPERLDQIKAMVSLAARQILQMLQQHFPTSRLVKGILETLSHELRTPLSGLIGMTELIRERLPQTSELADVSEMVEMMDEAGRTLLHVFETVFEALTTFEGMPAAQPFRMADVLGSIIALYTPAATLKGLELIEEFEPELFDAELEGNLQGLYLTLTHLLSNALKFTDEGSISFKASMITLDADRVELRFDIADTGPGLPEELKKRVFDPFFRHQSNKLRRVPGTGLGLALVRRTVDSLGGTLRLDSCADFGTHVYLILPFRRLSAPADLSCEAARLGRTLSSGEVIDLSRYRSAR